MSTLRQRYERTKPGTEWLAPHKARKLRADVECARAELLNAGQVIQEQEGTIGRLRARSAELEDVIELLLQERGMTLGRAEA